MPHDHNEEWRILAEEARLEKDPDKLLEIVSALNRALDEREKTTGKNRQHLATPEREQETLIKPGT